MVILIALILLSAAVLAAAIAGGTLWYAADTLEKSSAE
jgi:hypothetical protein